MIVIERGCQGNDHKFPHSTLETSKCLIVRRSPSIHSLFIDSLLSLQDSDILNFGTGSVSWFESNGPGCKPVYPTNGTLEDPFRPIRPDRVDGCLLEYPIVEVIHSAVQNFLAVSQAMHDFPTSRLLISHDFLSIFRKLQLLGIIGAICIGCILWDDDDSCEYPKFNYVSFSHYLFT